MHFVLDKRAGSCEDIVMQTHTSREGQQSGLAASPSTSPATSRDEAKTGFVMDTDMRMEVPARG